MKLLKNPIFWVALIVLVVVVIGYKIMTATFLEQEALKQKTQERVLTLKDYNLYSLAVIPPSTLWVAGSGGIALYSADAGDNWEERQVGQPEQLFTAVAFPDKDHGFLTGNRGTILQTQDGGKTWNRVERKDTTFFLNMFFLDPQHGWIVGETGTILLTADGGKTWENIQTDKLLTNFTDVFFLDTTRGWIIGEQGIVMASTDGGRTWKDQQSNTTKSLMSITATVDGEKITLWVGGLEGTLITSNDLGVTWEPKPLKFGEQKITNHVYRIYDKLSGTKGLGHHQVYTLCRNTQQYTFDGGVGWRGFMLDQKTSALLQRSWLHDMEFYRSSADALGQESGWAAEVADQGESSLLSLAVVGMLTVGGWVFLAPGLEELAESPERLRALLTCLVVALLATAVSMPVMLWDLVRFSHRFAGPMVRLRNSMLRAAAGEHVAPIRFRNGDYWQDLADAFNAMQARIEQLEQGRAKDVA